MKPVKSVRAFAAVCFLLCTAHVLIDVVLQKGHIIGFLFGNGDYETHAYAGETAK